MVHSIHIPAEEHISGDGDSSSPQRKRLKTIDVRRGAQDLLLHRLDRMEQRQQLMEETQQQMWQHMRNVKARRGNNNNCAKRSNALNDTLMVLRKETPGWGTPLPGNHGQVPDGDPPRPGTLCPQTVGLFPATVQDCLDLSHDQIGNLSIWFNDDFDIVLADSITARRAKFMSFIAN